MQFSSSYSLMVCDVYVRFISWEFHVHRLFKEQQQKDPESIDVLERGADYFSI